MKERFYERPIFEVLCYGLSPIVILVLWEAGARLHYIDARFFPAPTDIATTLGEMIESGELVIHTTVSLKRIFLGFLLGAVPGVLLGVTMGFYRPAKMALDPLIAAFYPIPKVALLPLIMLIFGLGELSKIVVIASGVFFICVINGMAGVRSIDQAIIEAAQSFGAKHVYMIKEVILPGSTPAIFAGLRLSLGLALILIVAAEFVAAEKGLGYLIWSSWTVFYVSRMYVGLLAVAALGMIFTYVLEWVERVAFPWQATGAKRSR